MKKKFLLTAGLAAALTAGMAFTSLAGWEEHDGQWYFYKNNILYALIRLFFALVMSDIFMVS